MEAPNVNAAIRASCAAWRPSDVHPECTYPACDCAPVWSDMIVTALRTVFPKEPSANMLEAVMRGMLTEDPIAMSMLEEIEILALAVAAYKALPIYPELWGEE